MKAEKLMDYIGQIDDRIVAEANNETAKKKSYKWKRLAPAAACLILAAAVTGVLGRSAGWFGGKIYTAELANGTLNFYKLGAGLERASIDPGVARASRDLTDDENKLLFGGVFGDKKFEAHGLFDDSLVHVETRSEWDENRDAGHLKIIMAASNLGYITDTVVETDRRISEIGGVPVSAGYFVTDANSRGERNIIYIASYETGGVTVYVEYGGGFERSEELKTEAASTVGALIQKGAPDLSSFPYQR